MNAQAIAFDDVFGAQTLYPDEVELAEGEARVRYSRFSARQANDTPTVQLATSDSVEALIDESIDLLEFRRVAAGVIEALATTGTKTYGEAHANFDKILEIADQITRIDVASVLSRLPKKSIYLKQTDPDIQLPTFEIEPFLRSVSSLLEIMPLDDLVFLGNKFGLQKKAHRVRTSYHWLSNFVRRHQNGHDDLSSHIIGRFYMQGGIEVQEAAAALKMDLSDCAAFLEDNGYARDIRHIRLTEEKRKEKLLRISAFNLKKSAPDSQTLREIIDREVVASQRIEGIDARKWVHNS